MAHHIFAEFQAMMLRSCFDLALGRAALEQRLPAEA